MPSRADVQKNLQSLQNDFTTLVRCIDRADAVAAGKQARQILDGIRSMLDSIQANLTKDFIEHRLPTFENDRGYISGFEQKLPTREDLDRLSVVAVNIAKDLRALKRLTCTVYSRAPFPWKTILRLHGLKAVIVLVAIAGVFGARTAMRKHAASRQGLTARYYSDMEMKTLAKETIDQKIEFPWGEGGPLNDWRRSEFSILWTGYIRVPSDDKWTFYTHSDDGVRLFIADTPLINDWNRHGTKINRAEVKLEAGYYPIRIEYFEHMKRAEIKLYWKSAAAKAPEIVPQSALVPMKSYLPGDARVFEVLESSGAVISSAIFPAQKNAPDAKPATDAKKAKAPAKKDSTSSTAPAPKK